MRLLPRQPTVAPQGDLLTWFDLPYPAIMKADYAAALFLGYAGNPKGTRRMPMRSHRQQVVSAFRPFVVSFIYPSNDL